MGVVVDTIMTRFRLVCEELSGDWTKGLFSKRVLLRGNDGADYSGGPGKI